MDWGDLREIWVKEMNRCGDNSRKDGYEPAIYVIASRLHGTAVIIAEIAQDKAKSE